MAEFTSLDEDEDEIIPRRTVPPRRIPPPIQLVGGLYDYYPGWNTWCEICRYTGWNMFGPLKPIKYHNFVLPFNAQLGMGTALYDEWMWRYNHLRPLRIAVVGEAGLTKSYTSIWIARIISKDRFHIGRIAFEGDDFLRLQDEIRLDSLNRKIRETKRQLPIIIEEPAYIFAARTWQKAEQQQGVRVIETTRYKNIPLIFPVVNRNLLDKIVREFYINYVCEMTDIGIGTVWFTYRRQWETFTRRKRKSKMYVYWPGVEISRCGRETCLFCPELPTCNKYIWPQYERKRAAILEKRREADRERDKEEEKKSKPKLRDLYHDDFLPKLDTLYDRKDRVSVSLIEYYLGVNKTTAQGLKALHLALEAKVGVS